MAPPTSYAALRRALRWAIFIHHTTRFSLRRTSFKFSRRSTTRSKDRKMRYIAELKRKLQALQTEETCLSAQLSLLQKDTDDLTAQNSGLKLELQTLERQVHLIDALDEAVKEEVQHLEVQMGQTIQNGGPMMNLPASYGANPHPDHDDMATLLTVQQFQRFHIHSQNQQQRSSMQPQVQARDLNLRGSGPSSI